MPPWDLTCSAVLFDMDGTLVDSTAVVEAVWAEFAGHLGVDVAEVLTFAHGRLTLDTVSHFCPPDRDAVAIAAELDERELVRLDGIVEVPGAARLLAGLAGAPVAVVTSASQELAARRMRAAGLAAPAVVVTADEVEWGKPHPQGYLLAAARLGVAPHTCAIFEDAEAGLAAGVAAGGHVVVVGEHHSAITRSLPRVHDLSGVDAQVLDGLVHLTAEPGG